MQELFVLGIILSVMSWLGSASLAAWLAGEKRRNSVNWFWLGLLFGPVALIAVVGAPWRPDVEWGDQKHR